MLMKRYIVFFFLLLEVIGLHAAWQVHLHPGFYCMVADTLCTVESELTLPAPTWNKSIYDGRLIIAGWEDELGQLVGKSGDHIAVTQDMNLYLRYEVPNGPTEQYFYLVQQQSDLYSIYSDSLQVVLINGSYVGSSNTDLAKYSGLAGGAGYYDPGPLSIHERVYDPNGKSDSQTRPFFASTVKGVGYVIKLDLTPCTYHTRDNNALVWHIKEDTTTFTCTTGAWGREDKTAYGKNNSWVQLNKPGGKNDSWISRWVIHCEGLYCKIEWADWTSDNYRYMYMASAGTTYDNHTIKVATGTEKAAKWQVFRLAHRVGFDMGIEMDDYATCVSELYPYERLTLPNITWLNDALRPYITIYGWVDQNGEFVGRPGQTIDVTENMELHLSYSIAKFRVTYDAGELGTCDIDYTESLWPFQLPDVHAQDGYDLLGWFSYFNDKMVGRAGDYYPATTPVLTHDDDLYAVYQPTYRVLTWEKDAVVIEMLHHAHTILTELPTGETTTTLLSDCKVDEGVYRVPVSAEGLQKNMGKKLIIKVEDVAGQALFTSGTTIPVIVSKEYLLSDLDRGQCASMDLWVTDGGVAVADSNFAPYTFRHVVVAGGGKLRVPIKTTLVVDSVTLLSGDVRTKYVFSYPQMVVNGSLQNKSQKVRLNYLLNADQYYSLVLPYDVPFATMRYTDGTLLRAGIDVSAAYYDGAKRATVSSGWLPYNEPILRAGIGYIIAATPQNVTFTDGSHVRRHYSAVTMTMMADLTAGETSVDKETPVHSYPALQDNDAGWNLVGNPYLANYSGAVDGLSENGIGLLVEDAKIGYEWQGNVRYVVIPSNDGRSYRSMLAQDTVLPPFRNFFVQIGEGDALRFVLANRAQQGPARRYGWTNDWDITTGIRLVSMASGEGDALGVLIGDDYSAEYEINADLAKWRNSELNLYALADTNELAFIALNSDLAQSIAIGYDVPQMGHYVISLDKRYSHEGIEAIWLMDANSGRTINLMQQDYEFITNTTRDNSRFVLSVQLQRYLPTGWDGKELLHKIDGKIIQGNQLMIIHNHQLYNAHGMKR